MQLKTICLLVFLTKGLLCLSQDEQFKPGPDSQRQNGIPRGTVTKYSWQSKLLNNFRDFQVYVPAQYDSTKPAALMVFQDGFTYVNEEGSFRVPVVMDNLIARKELPVIICIFVNPGHNSSTYPEDLFRSVHRSEEYDELSDRYVNFLIQEIIPEVKKKYNISTDPAMHAIGGISSGGICAFTAAWQRPDYFLKVMSHVGSFTNIRGGHLYPDLVRKSPKKPIKIFMQDGSNDLNNQFGDWWLGNLQMESSFKYRGYDFKFEKGTGGHNGKHGGAILPESLKWLWSDVMINKN